MLNNDNIAYLENNNYKYILAYKIKNISNDLKEKIKNLTFIDDNVTHNIEFKKLYHLLMKMIKNKLLMSIKD